MRVFQQLLQLVLSDCLVLEIKFLAPVADFPEVTVRLFKLCVYFLQYYCELFQIQLLFEGQASPLIIFFRKFLAFGCAFDAGYVERFLAYCPCLFLVLASQLLFKGISHYVGVELSLECPYPLELVFQVGLVEFRQIFLFFSFA